jgi:hypothetical protein
MQETGDETAARSALVKEAQGNTPLVAGVLVGIIGASAGRYLEPVFTNPAAGIGSRFARGFGAETLQEGPQSGAEQIAQNIAAQTYDKSRSMMQGVPEQVVQGGIVGGLTGGGFGVVAGGGGRRTAAAPAPEETTPAAPTGSRPAGRGPDTFADVFGEDTGPASFDSVFTIDDAPVRSDVAAAAAALREDNKMVDLFPDTLTPQQPTPFEAGRDLNTMQGQLPLQGGEMGQPRRMPLPAAPPGGQAELPLTRRERGYGAGPYATARHRAGREPA